jgi:capsular exopolysaccharide synthesis family protein
MTIIESAIERARELTHGVPPASAAPPHANFQRATIATLQPHTRIHPRAVQLNREACRENRLLLSATDEEANGAVAAYRMLRTRILHRIRAQRWMTIGVTSTGPGDGKTLTALNLSFSLAREKNSDVILLDLDMRNPSVCRALHVQPPRELREFFEGSSAPDDLFFSIGIDHLMIASQVAASAQASELLANNRFEELVGYVRQNSVNPIVLIDLPPVLSTDDALVLAPRIDALLLVVSEGLTDRAELERATELLSEFKLAGVVMNQSSESISHYGYGYERNYK